MSSKQANQPYAGIGKGTNRGMNDASLLGLISEIGTREGGRAGTPSWWED